MTVIQFLTFYDSANIYGYYENGIKKKDIDDRIVFFEFIFTVISFRIRYSVLRVMLYIYSFHGRTSRGKALALRGLASNFLALEIREFSVQQQHHHQNTNLLVAAMLSQS